MVFQGMLKNRKISSYFVKLFFILVMSILFSNCFVVEHAIINKKNADLESKLEGIYYNSNKDDIFLKSKYFLIKEDNPKKQYLIYSCNQAKDCSTKTDKLTNVCRIKKIKENSFILELGEAEGQILTFIEIKEDAVVVYAVPNYETEKDLRKFKQITKKLASENRVIAEYTEQTGGFLIKGKDENILEFEKAVFSSHEKEPIFVAIEYKKIKKIK